jgi:signal transduction histidine kinase
LVVADDGLGFDPEHHAAKRNGHGGFGLLSMRERVAFVGGALKVKSIRGGGTAIDVRIPINL